MKIFYYVLLLTAIFASSTYSQTKNIPENLLGKIVANSKKYPEHVREIWIKQQKDAYLNLSNIENFGVPHQISLDNYIKFCDIVSKEHPDDYVKQLSALHNFVAIKTNIDAIKSTYPKEIINSCDEYMRQNYGDDIRSWNSHYTECIDFFSYDISSLGLSKEESILFYKRAIDISGKRMYSAKNYLDKQVQSKGKIIEMESDSDKKIIVSELKEEALKLYPQNFVEQYKYIKEKIDAGYISRADQIKIKKASDIMGSVFIRKIDEKLSAIAVLASLEDRVVVLCTREFIPDKFPVVLTNDNGVIVCSSAIVSKNYKVLALIPDSIPDNFKPIRTSSVSKPLSGREYQLVTATPEGVYSYPVSFASKTIEGYSQFMAMGNRSNFTRPTKKTFSSFSDYPKGKVISKGKNSSFHRSIIVDLDTFEMIAFAVDMNDSPREGFNRVVARSSANAGGIIMNGSSEVRHFDWEMAAKLYAEHYNVPVDVVWERHSYGNKEAVSFVEVCEFSDKKSWEQFNLAKYFYTERYIDNYMLVNKSIFGLISANTLSFAESDPIFSKIALQYSATLRSRLDYRSYESKYRAYYSSIYYAIKQAGACRIPLSDFYILNRNDAIAAQATRNLVIKSMNDFMKMKNISMYIHSDLKKIYEESRKSIKN